MRLQLTPKRLEGLSDDEMAIVRHVPPGSPELVPEGASSEEGAIRVCVQFIFGGVEEKDDLHRNENRLVRLSKGQVEIV